MTFHLLSTQLNYPDSIIIVWHLLVLVKSNQYMRAAKYATTKRRRNFVQRMHHIGNYLF